MSINRRELLAGFGGLAASAALRPLRAAPARLTSADDGAAAPAQPASADAAAAAALEPGFPRKGDFAIPAGLAYINGAYIHPMPVATADAIRAYADRRARPDGMTGAESPARAQVDVRAEFAGLINAKVSEISTVPNTSAGENLVVNGLGIRRFDGNVVTDALHFDGALVNLRQLQKEGLDLRVVMPRADHRIHVEDLARVIDRKTRLVEVSLVAMYNGFQHDLKAVCDLAHSQGAHVYADIIQGVGAVPVDVKASGVDFCACSSFKWLMSDFGLGFLYVREELLDTVIRRSQIGYHSTTDMDTHFSPFDPEIATPLTWTMRGDASGHFETGSTAAAAEAALRVSLPYIRKLGVENIQAHRQPLLTRIREGMTALGFTPATPEDSTSPIITFATKDGTALEQKLRRARVDVRVAPYWIRVSPSIYNDLGDIEQLLDALR
jgi:selenocysteine lyase/cysteine desulfurase